MKTVTLMRGLPGSGKSTIAKKLISEKPNMYKRINRDDLRQMFDNYHVSKGNEKFVKKIRNVLILEALKDGKHVIVDDTNLSEKNYNSIKELVRKYQEETGEQVTVKVHEVNTPVEECIQRDAQRARPVGRQVIMRMHQQFYAPQKKEQDKHIVYREQNKELPEAIICDLDGTLAIINDRSPFDAARCGNDLLNQPVYDLVTQYQELGVKIILLSGRNGEFKQQTVDWLEKFKIKYDVLLMRKEKDSRKDSIIKREIFEEYIENQYYIKFVLDDRDQVVDMWRQDLNLPCLQVNYGDF